MAQFHVAQFHATQFDGARLHPRAAGGRAAAPSDAAARSGASGHAALSRADAAAVGSPKYEIPPYEMAVGPSTTQKTRGQARDATIAADDLEIKKGRGMRHQGASAAQRCARCCCTLIANSIARMRSGGGAPWAAHRAETGPRTERL